MSRGPAPDEAWIGLGTNLGDREANLRAAVDYFAESFVDVAPVLETEPWGIVEQPWFLNTVVRLRWTAGARSLLSRCLATEQALGRVRVARNGPRTIDIDVLPCGPGRPDEPGLRVPHPGIATRRSVLEPWAALAPNLLVPGLDATLSDLEVRTRGLAGHGSRPWPSNLVRASGTL